MVDSCLVEDAKFDWYAASCNDLPESLKDYFSELGTDWRDRSPNNGYKRCQSLDFEDSLITLSYGGVDRPPHVVGTGKAAQPVSEFLRLYSRDHRVARVDVALDMEADGLYDHGFEMLRELALSGGVKTARAGDWDSEVPARTFYMGATSSQVRNRWYEKGREKLAQDPLCGASPNWCRFETQIRPATSEMKRYAARMEPSEFFGVSRHTKKAVESLAGLEVKKAAWSNLRTRGTDERSLYFLAKQYGNLLARLAEAEGGWDKAGVHLGDLIDQLRGTGRS